MNAARESALILVVDDNQMERFIAREALEIAGFEVVEACDGEEGLALFEALAPDVVLLDVKMPVKDGFATCAALRAGDAGHQVPVLMLTGLDDLDSINRAYDVGATDFYAKPINVAILVHRVRYLLRAKRLSDDLRDSRAQLAYAQRLAKLGCWRWERATGEFSWSAEVATILGRAPASIGGADALSAFIPGTDRSVFEAGLARAMGSGAAASIEHRIVREDGSVRFVEQEIEASLAPDGTVERIDGTLQDITERRQTEERIRHLAYHDPVTGLPNRMMLREQLGHALSHARRAGRAVAVMFLDLDRFKRVNDTLGHGAGDDLLREVASRLSESLRECDYLSRDVDENDFAPREHTGNVPSTVARIGGDEFVVLLGDMRTLADAAIVARRIRESMSDPFDLQDNVVHVSTSIGISGYPDDGKDPDSLLKHADAAMYHAKAQGRDCYQFFTASINDRTVERFNLEASLRKAIDEEELVLYYQPIIGLRERAVIGVEALIRWQHPTRGMVSPAEFIPLAEETGLIIPLGQWVVKEACRELTTWNSSGLTELGVSINVSAAQFTDRAFRGQVQDALAESGVDACRIELELTESMLMRDSKSSVGVLQALKELGVRIAVDDFGTGYSSLAYLKRFPIDSLKIDQSFIRDVTSDADNEAIVSATIGLARSLRLNVIAEGVEEQAQLNYLLAENCDACQGYLFARPMPAAELSAWFAADVVTGVIPAPDGAALARIAHA